MTQPTKIKAVIFDMGGVILRTGNPQPREALAARLGVTSSDLDKIVFQNPVAQAAESGRATPDEVWAEVGRMLNLADAEIPVVAREFFAGDAVDFELIAFIQKLRPTYNTALLSNTWIVDMPNWLKEKWQIPETFDFIISSAKYQVAKPDPRIFRTALEIVHAAADETIFVDDAHFNIAAANALGIHTVHFHSTNQAIEEIKRLAPLV